MSDIHHRRPLVRLVLFSLLLAQIFSLTRLLIKGTVAEDWPPELANRIKQATNSAIQVQPNLAAAYFLRGWGEYLANANDSAARYNLIPTSRRMLKVMYT